MNHFNTSTSSHFYKTETISILNHFRIKINDKLLKNHACFNVSTLYVFASKIVLVSNILSMLNDLHRHLIIYLKNLQNGTKHKMLNLFICLKCQQNCLKRQHIASEN